MRKKILSAVLTYTMLICGTNFSYAAENEYNIYVNADIGNDENNGTSEQTPVKSLARANQKAKAVSGIKKVTVNFAPGVYTVDELQNITTSGNKEYPVIYRGDGNVTIRGAKSVPKKIFKEVSDEEVLKRLSADARTNVLCADLSELGIWGLEINPRVRGITEDNTSCEAVELFSDNEDIRLARWPNDNFAYNGYCSSNKAFQTEPIYMENLDKRQLSWVDENGVLREKYAQIEAFSDADYRTAGTYLTGIDSDTGYMLLKSHTDSGGAYMRESRYYVFNILEELDDCGEYYIDRKNSLLYLYPPENFTDDLYLSQTDKGIISMDGAKYISFEGINFEGSRMDAVTIKNCSNITFRNFEIKNCGNNGISIINSTNVLFDNGRIFNIGKCGIAIEEGINNELIKSENIIKSTDIFNVSRTSAATVSAIKLSGVGNKISECIIHDCPASGIGMSGLKHEISDNELYNLCSDISDWGAIYIGRSWSFRGNAILRNYFHDITNHGIIAIYLDDYMSGMRVEENAFVNCNNAVVSSGGRDNVIINNFMYNCTASVVASTHWGINDPKWHAKDNESSDNLYKRLISVPYLSKLKEEYPEVSDLLLEYEDENYPDNHPEYPKNCVIYNNKTVNSPCATASDEAKQFGNIEILDSVYYGIYKID
ncbi:MAG: right-handed parallel beta-helix repeat-containing protein [Clostridia bacterium]|nr:right-handed parallel beta-helix repeat-containing protein [Clostridia bacterium]